MRTKPRLNKALSAALLSLRVAYEFPKQEAFASHLGISVSRYRDLECGRAGFTRIMIAKIQLHYPDFGTTQKLNRH